MRKLDYYTFKFLHLKNVKDSLNYKKKIEILKSDTQNANSFYY